MHPTGSGTTMPAWIVLLVLCSRYCQSAAISCGDTEYEKDGRCCSLCGPGRRLVKECTESNETVCVACQHGSYQDKWNRETSCVLHHYCDQNLGFQKISEGTAHKNVDCVCQDGRHCSNAQCETCVFNTPCGPGYGVTQKADRDSDTNCTPCPEGTFSNITSDTEPCKDWQRCASSQEIRPGTASADFVCGPRQKNSAWIIVVVVLVGLIIGLVVFFFIRRKRRAKKVEVTRHIEDPPERGNNHPLLHLHKPNLPEEDQDTTMQGLPVAQEEGKDYHISQEEK